MKKVFCILSVLMLTFPVFAEGEVEQIDKTQVVAAASYVDGLAAVKQDTLNSDNVTQGDGAIVTGVTASDGTVTVTRSYEVTIPVGSVDNTARAQIWVE